VLIGWQFRIQFLKTPFPDTAFMAPNAALCFILVGLSLWWQREKGRAAKLRFLGKICAAVVFVFSCLTLVEYATEFDFSIDLVFLLIV
jgi:hypothetical protein